MMSAFIESDLRMTLTEQNEFRRQCRDVLCRKMKAMCKRGDGIR